MTVTNQDSSVTANGNGVTTTWPYTFLIEDEDFAFVGIYTIATESLALLDPSDYTISGIGDEAGGEVEYPLMGAPLSGAFRIVIYRELPYEQNLALTDQSPYLPSTLEAQLDNIVMQIQQLAEQMGRSIKVTLGSGLTPDDFIEDLQQGAAEAQASADAAAISADAAALAASSITLPADPTPLYMLRRNAGDTAYEERSPAEVAADIGAVRYSTDVLGGFRNKLINALGAINQRAYVSGAATSGANQYTLDRWRVVTSGQNLSWAESAGVRTMTAPAGGVEQVVTGGGIIGGSYVLNWTGTATATVNGTPRTKGEVFTLTGGADVTIRFIGGTFSLPQLEEGASITPFASRPIAVELVLCYWYFEALVGAAGGVVASGFFYTTALALCSFAFKPKRTGPTCTATAASGFQAFGPSTSYTGSGITVSGDADGCGRLDLVIAGAVAGQGTSIRRDAGATISINAEH